MDELEYLEPLDFDGDQAELDTLHQDVRILNRYYDEIAAQGGISREQAALLVRDCGLQLSESMPLQSFTEVPSRTNYQVTLEGLASRMAQRVWELIKRAAAILLKIARWILDAIRSAMGKATNVAAAVEATAEMTRLEKTYPAPTQTAATPDTPGIRTARRLLEQTARHYSEHYNELVEDLLKDAAIHTTIRNVAIQALPYLDITEMKLSLYTDLVNQLNRGVDAVGLMALKRQLTTIAEPIRSSQTRQHFRHGELAVVASDELTELISQLRQSQLARRNQSRRDGRWAQDPEAALDEVTLKADDVRFTAPYIVDVGHWHDRLEKMSEQLNTLLHMHVPAFADPDIAMAFHVAFQTIEREFNAYRTLIVTAESARTVRDQFIYDLFEYQKAQLMLRKELIQVAEDREALRLFTAELQRLREKIQIANQKAA